MRCPDARMPTKTLPSEDYDTRDVGCMCARAPRGGGGEGGFVGVYRHVGRVRLPMFLVGSGARLNVPTLEGFLVGIRVLLLIIDLLLSVYQTGGQAGERPLCLWAVDTQPANAGCAVSLPSLVPHVLCLIVFRDSAMRPEIRRRNQMLMTRTPIAELNKTDEAMS